MKKHWYAIEYAYGDIAVNLGNIPDIIGTFNSKAERDAWVANGTTYSNESGHRSAITALYLAWRRRTSATTDLEATP